jgi:hypothetical protein
MTTTEEAFEKYYPEFYYDWVEPQRLELKPHLYPNLYKLLSDFPLPRGSTAMAMVVMEMLVRKLNDDTVKLKQALLEYIGDVTDEERDYIVLDKYYTERLEKWRRIFSLIFQLAE